MKFKRNILAVFWAIALVGSGLSWAGSVENGGVDLDNNVDSVASAANAPAPNVPLAATLINFESDTSGTKPNGWQSVDSVNAFFSNFLGTQSIGNYGSQSHGQAIAAFNEPGFQVIDFAMPMRSISVDFGNDDTCCSVAGDEIEIRAFLGGNPVGASQVVMNRNDIMDQTITFDADCFDEVEIEYNTSTYLIEVLDNIILEECGAENGVTFTFVEAGGTVTMTSSGTLDTTQLVPVALPDGWGGTGTENNNGVGDIDIMGGTSFGPINTQFGFNAGTDASAIMAPGGPFAFSNFSGPAITGSKSFTTYSGFIGPLRQPGIGIVGTDIIAGEWTPDQNWTYGAGETFATLGLNPGTYAVSDSVTSETITIQVGATASSVLYGVTGDGGAPSETLFILDQTDASSTFVMTLGNGNDGEEIAYNPDDGLLYHASGFANPFNDPNGKILETIDPVTLTVTPVNLSGYEYFEVAGLTYAGSGVLLAGDIGAGLGSITTAGVSSFVGSTDHVPTGLAFVGPTLYSVAKDNLLRTVNPATGGTNSSVPITLAGLTVLQGNGLATNPVDNTLWALLKVAEISGQSRVLVTVDSATGVATNIGTTDVGGMAGIAFVSTGAPVNNPPVADAGPDQAIECAGDPDTTVQLDGTASYDPDPGDSIAAYLWTGGTFTPDEMSATPTVDVPLGVHVFGLQVFDTFGLDDSDSVEVTVSDTVDPIIVAPADISEQHTAHPHFIADLGTPTVTEVCGYTVGNDAPAGNLFPLGLTVVTWTVTDTAGNTSSDTQDVWVLNTAPDADDQSPVVIEDSVANVITLTASDINNDSPLVFAVVGGSGPSHGTLGGAAPNLTYTPDPDYFGPDEFKFTATDEHGATSAEATVSITVTPVNDPPVISISRATATVQYSDTIGTVTITATDVDDDPLTLSSEYTDNGVLPAIAGLPSDLGTAGGCVAVPNDTSSDGTSCSWDLTGQMLEDEGDYDITFTVTDGGGGEGTIESDSGATEIIVNPEDASISFDENNEVAIQVDGDGSDSSLPFSLTVYIDETEPDIATFIAMYGDLSLAVPHMQLTPVGPGGPEGPDSCDTSVAGTGYDQVMTYTCHFSGVPVNTYSVDVNVDGGYYIGENDDVFTVFDPSLGFTTGGGWFYWPGTNDKTNFGYVMKYNKKRTNLQGSLLMIRHVEGSTTGEKWRIKSNALEGLSIGSDPDFGWAAFSGKATYRSPTEENEGNNEFTVYVEDHGVPGRGVDQFWVQTRDKQDDVRPDLSMPEPGAGNTETIEGGNIFVPHTSKGRGK